MKNGMCVVCGNRSAVPLGDMCTPCIVEREESARNAVLSDLEDNILRLQAENAEAKAFAERLSEELDKANATINRLGNMVLQRNARIAELEIDDAVYGKRGLRTVR